MNVLFLTSRFWPEGSGGQLATYLYAKLLGKNGVDVRVISGTSKLDGVGKNTGDGATAFRVPTRGFGSNTKYATAMKTPILLYERSFIRSIDWADVVYMTGWFPAIPLIKHKFRKPVVVHLHSYFPACPIGSLYNLKEGSICNPNNHLRTCAKCIACHEKAHMKSSSEILTSALLNSTIGRSFINFIRFADAVIFVSKTQKNLFLRHAPSIAPISHVVYNPLPELHHTPIIGDDLGYFGGRSPLKGFQVLMKAWAKIQCKHYNLKIHVTKMDDLLSFRSLEAIRIIPYGRLSEKSYEDVYKKIRAVIIPSIWPEPLPYVVSEALLRGRVVAASHVGGIPEIVDGLKGVFLISMGDVDELANAIEEVLSMDREEVEELGIENRGNLLKKFDNQRTINKLICVFQKVSRHAS